MKTLFFMLVIFALNAKQLCAFNPLDFMKKSWIEYQAHQAYQSKNFKKSEKEYAKLLADNSYDAQTNYNVGVSLYKQQQFQEAQQYFNRAAIHALEKSDLQQQAIFNQANSLVQLQKLQDAIEKYEQLLKINPEHEAARKNLEIVKQMLEQQKQQEKNDEKKNKKDKNKNNQEQKNKDQNNDQEQENQQSQDQSSKNEQSEQQQKKSGKQDKKEQSGQSNDQQNANEQEQNSPEKDLKKSKNKKTDEKKEQADKEQRKAEHEKSLQKSDKKEKSDDMQSLDEKQAQKENANLDDALAAKLLSSPKDDERLDKRSAALLEKLDDYEKNIQKKLLQLNVTKQGAKQNGQKNW